MVPRGTHLLVSSAIVICNCQQRNNKTRQITRLDHCWILFIIYQVRFTVKDFANFTVQYHQKRHEGIYWNCGYFLCMSFFPRTTRANHPQAISSLAFPHMVLGRSAILSILKLHRNILLTTSTGALRRRFTFQSTARCYKFEIHLLSWLQHPIECADHRRYLTGI